MLFVYEPRAIRPNALSTKVYCNQLWHSVLLALIAEVNLDQKWCAMSNP